MMRHFALITPWFFNSASWFGDCRKVGVLAYKGRNCKQGMLFESTVISFDVAFVRRIQRFAQFASKPLPSQIPVCCSLLARQKSFELEKYIVSSS